MLKWTLYDKQFAKYHYVCPMTLSFDFEDQGLQLFLRSSQVRAF